MRPGHNCLECEISEQLVKLSLVSCEVGTTASPGGVSVVPSLRRSGLSLRTVGPVAKFCQIWDRQPEACYLHHAFMEPLADSWGTMVDKD